MKEHNPQRRDWQNNSGENQPCKLLAQFLEDQQEEMAPMPGSDMSGKSMKFSLTNGSTKLLTIKCSPPEILKESSCHVKIHM